MSLGTIFVRSFLFLFSLVRVDFLSAPVLSDDAKIWCLLACIVSICAMSFMIREFSDGDEKVHVRLLCEVSIAKAIKLMLFHEIRVI